MTIVSIIAILALLGLAIGTLYWERSRAGAFLSAALVVTGLLELLDLVSLLATEQGIAWKQYALLAEALLPSLWILASLTYARQHGPWRIGRLRQTLIALALLFGFATLLLPLGDFFYAPDFPHERVLFLGQAGYYFYIGIMTGLVCALVNFETTLANASPESLWKIKYDMIGLGTILAVLVFYFSQALLYRTISMNYMPMRSCLYLLGSGLVAYSQFCRRGRVRIQVSRQTAYKSVVLMAVGGYLVAIGLLGEGMKYFGMDMPRTVSVSLVFLGGVGVLVLLLSGRVRREVKVVLHKNFYQHKHDYRTQWLRFSEQLATSSSGDQLLQRILVAYCDIFGTSGGVLFLNEPTRSGFCVAAAYEMEPADLVIAPDNSLMRFMEQRAWVVNVRDDNPEIMAENAAFFADNHISLVIPLFARERQLEGFIALGRTIKPDEIFIYEDYDLMKTIARQASLAIMHQRLSEQLSQTREVEAIGKVSAFVAHDLKNLVSNISLIVENAARHIHNPDFQQDMLASLGNTATKMQTLIGRLKNLGERELYNLQEVDLLELAHRTCNLVSGAPVTVAGTGAVARVDENEIQNVIMNLLMNGIEASPQGQPLRVEVGHQAALPYIRVSDQGSGMSSQYIRTELFKPFSTTKRHGLGIGLYQCRQIVEAHGGRIEVNSTLGEGTDFTVWLPGA